MEIVRTLKFTHSFNGGFLFPLTLVPNPTSSSSSSIRAKPFRFVHLLSVRSSLTPQPQQSRPTEHTTLLVETFHEHRRLKSLLKRLSKKDSCPLKLLRDDEDWTKEHFWAVIRYLRHDSRSNQILQVFDVWKNIEKSRINELNYNKIIKLLNEEDLMEEAVMLFKAMKSHGLSPYANFLLQEPQL